jgi:hypothetical protein
VPVLAEVKNSLGPRSGRDGFVCVCAAVCKLLSSAYRAGVIVGAIEVEVDIADAESTRYDL